MRIGMAHAATALKGVIAGSLVVCVAILLMANARTAPNPIPIRIGIYVLKDTPCLNASNAATLSYWGGRNGINGSKDGCSIKTHRHVGSRHILLRSCESIYGGSYDSRLTIDVHSTEAFTVTGGNFYTAGSSLRYCGPKVQRSRQR